MVLDIAGGRLPERVGLSVPLVIKRASSTRAQCQSWRFTEEGRLLLDTTPHLCVQSKPGYESLREGKLRSEVMASFVFNFAEFL